jgi:hypothetical protein
VAPARRRRHSRCRAVRPGRRRVLFGLGPVGEEAAGLPAHRCWSMPRPWPAVGVRPIYPLLTAAPEVLVLWLLAAIGDSGGAYASHRLGRGHHGGPSRTRLNSSGNRRRDLPEENTEVCCFGAVIGCIGPFVAIRQGNGRGAVVMEGQVVLLSGDAGLASTIGRLLSDGDRIARYYSAELADWSTPRQAHPGGRPGRRVEQGAGRQRKLHRVANAQAHRGSAVATQGES